MARLSYTKPRIGFQASRIAQPTRIEQKRQHDIRRDDSQEWRAWYKTARWQQLRMQVLTRDLFTCQKTGIILSGKHPAPNSPVADHKIPHRGDPALFWNIDNIHAVSKEYHDGTKQSIEKSGQQASSHPKWLKPSTIPLTIVCGPPASGKSTYVARHAGPDDLVVDLDVIASALSGEPLHNWNRDKWLNAALLKRNDLLGDLGRRTRHKAAWLIVSEPKAKYRQWWQDTIKPDRIVVIETSEGQCIANAERDEGRNVKLSVDGVVRWWFEYERRQGDEVVKWANP